MWPVEYQRRVTQEFFVGGEPASITYSYKTESPLFLWCYHMCINGVADDPKKEENNED